MRGRVRQWVGGKALRVVAAAALLVGAVGSASAGDGDFFQQLFGGGGDAAPAQPQYAPAAPDDGGARYDRRMERRASRPLTVRLHRPKITHIAVAKKSGTAGKITMYDDPTLRRGDAVMTIRGMRIFAGSRTWPYTDRDFVSVADAGRMDKSLQKTLIALDSLPRQ